MSTLVIPDVHGRGFWRDAVKKYPDTDTIFLGDYLDPYPSEGVSAIETIANFEHIISHARANASCRLLLGNHDLHYLCDFGEACRMDYANHAQIRWLLRDNLDLFDIAALRDIDGKKVVFCHSAILRSWIHDVGAPESPDALTEFLNSLVPELLTSPGHVARVLGHISRYRGGYEPFGSPIWADAREVRDLNLVSAADYSVFGHTQLVKDPIISARWACLDCRRAFLVSPGATGAAPVTIREC